MLYAVEENLVQLFGESALQPGFQFVSMHLRLGGMPQEKVLKINKGSSRGPLADLIGGMNCANELGE